ncbi:MAG: BlaI/MecI/CopY family transcriptional regulator [Gemmatimonadaceae bacterium]
MPKKPQLHLSRRESQAMDVIYHLGEASAAEVLERVDDPPSYSAIRSTLNVLEEKGLVRHKMDGQRYVYYSAFPREKTSRAALARLLDTFFGGSPERAMAALLDMSSSVTSPEERARLSRMITEAKQEGR